MDYIAAGNVMSDIIEREDGSRSAMHLGGPAFFALAGIRLWTDSVKLCSGVGADFEEIYGPWMRANRVPADAVSVRADHTTLHVLRYLENGKYAHESIYGAQNLGYLKTRPEDLEAALDHTKGVYMAQNTDRVYWAKLARLKERHGFKFMLELEHNNGWEDVREICKLADYFSCNLNEASALLGIPREREEEIIAQLLRLPVEQIFFRVGARGSYALSGNTATFVPAVDIGRPVDPTGCGNCSTGSAMYAYTEGFDPIMTAVMANIAAAYNVLQYGPYPHFTEQTRRQAAALAEKLRADYPPLP